MKIFSNIRFLPITIFVAAMMLTLKISSIHDAIGVLISPKLDIAGAKAQNKDSATQEKAGEPTEIKNEDKTESEKPDKKESADKKEVVEKKEISSAERALAAVEGNDPETIMVNQDPTLLTPSEIELLQQLSERRKTLEGREQELEMRTGLLTAAEARIDKKIKELNNLRLTISSNIKVYDDQQDAKLLSLVKIYENMKPKDAARIFENLELETLLEVAERMKERKLAPIMAKMNADRAREVTVEIRQLRQLPPTGG